MNVPDGFGFTLFLVGLVTYLCFKTLEGGFGPNKDGKHTNITSKSILLAIVSIAAAMYVLGPMSGFVIVLGIAIHEFGHVAAFRAAGHGDARFRLIPLLGGVAISNKLPKNHLAEFYIAIMGPGIMLVPLVISGVYTHTIAGSNALLDQFMRYMFVFTGAINFFNLLPFWPLDGGRIVRSITIGLSPRIGQYVTLAMSGGLIAWAAYAKQPLILVVGIIGLSATRNLGKISKLQAPMTGGQAISATFAYLASLWAFWLAGSPLIKQLVFRTF